VATLRTIGVFRLTHAHPDGIGRIHCGSIGPDRWSIGGNGTGRATAGEYGRALPGFGAGARRRT